MGLPVEAAGHGKAGWKAANPQPNAAQSHEAVRHQLETILARPTFRTAPAQSNFLRYVVEETLAGRGDQIKEYSIGVEVFGRGHSFDPRVNNIVRAEANRLRSRLSKYYETEGLQSTIRIDLPKGGYTPKFLEAAALPLAAEVSTDASTEPRRIRFLRWKIASLLLLVAVLAGLSALLRRYQAKTAGAVAKPSIAVLPFLNLGGNKDDEVFSDGLTDDLIDSLGRVPRLEVVARTSAFQFKGKTLDVREIGRKLSVRSVLEGTVRKYGERLRITAELDDTRTGYRLWSGSYDRQARDALAIQREISMAITGELGLALGAGSRSSDSGNLANSVNSEAYENYLKGVYFWNKNTPASFDTAIGYLKQAIDADPGFALPYLGLARCYTGLSVMTATPARDVIPKLRESAQKALELDPGLGEAHVDLAEAYTFDFNWSAADEEFQKALALSPGSTVAHRWYAYYLEKMGRLDEALSENKRALELDPVSPYMVEGIADSLYMQRRYREAIEQFQKVLALDPGFAMSRQGLGLALVANGQYAEGISQLKSAVQLMGSDPWIDGQLAFSYAVSGQTERARQILHELLRRHGTGDVPALAIAEAYIGLNDRDGAFEWIERAVSNHELHLNLKADPIYDVLRPDQRFQSLLRRMKLS
jgi:adenylate cyclase